MPRYYKDKIYQDKESREAAGFLVRQKMLEKEEKQALEYSRRGQCFYTSRQKAIIPAFEKMKKKHISSSKI